MRNFIISIFICLILVNVSFADSKYENNLFSINALFSDENIANSQPLIMSLPASDGFAPNVNVQIQQYPNNLKSYADLSIKQFKQYNFKMLQNMQTNVSLIFEYSGDLQGRKLHWYAMAYKKGNNIFLITATSTESQWKSRSEALIACVKSFKLN